MSLSKERQESFHLKKRFNKFSNQVLIVDLRMNRAVLYYGIMGSYFE